MSSKKAFIISKISKNIKNTKIVLIAWYHTILTEMFTITKESAFLYENIKFLTSAKPSRDHRLLLILCR